MDREKQSGEAREWEVGVVSSCGVIGPPISGFNSLWMQKIQGRGKEDEGL
jgi:hypothetical protein